MNPILRRSLPIVILLAIICWVMRMTARPKKIAFEWEDEYEPTVRPDNAVKTYTEFRPMMNALLADISRAQHYILIQFFKFENDAAGNELAQSLIQKVRQGVRVVLMYDELSNIPQRKLFQKMKRGGVEIQGFGPLHIPTRRRDNYRNHRKIVVIDGTIGFTGGMNIAKRYEWGLTWGPWRDTHIRIEGPSVQDLTHSFASDWRYATGTTLILPQGSNLEEQRNGYDVEVLVSGPIGYGPVIHDKLISLIDSSHQRVYMESPYLIPTRKLLDSLKDAARRGVDVRILMPPHGDRGVLPPRASQAYIDEALSTGIKIGYYHGYMHSKLALFDDVATVGSTNIDPRSYFLDEEVNAFIYDQDYAAQMLTVFDADERHSEYLGLERWKKRSTYRKVTERIARLFSSQL